MSQHNSKISSPTIQAITVQFKSILRGFPKPEWQKNKVMQVKNHFHQRPL